MKTHHFSAKFHFLLAVLTGWLGQQTASAITFTVTPSAVSNTYSGLITLSIGGLANGEQVVVQKYLDVNTNGVLDSNDLLVDAFKLTDGRASVIGGVTNINVPYDQNPATGAITASLSFVAPEPLQDVVGSYIFQVSSPSNNFSPVTATFVITNASLAQSISGTIYSNGVAPLAGAVVVALAPSPGGGGKGKYAGGAVADSNGHYQLALNPGYYMLIPTFPGYFTDQSLGAQVNLTNGMSSTNNLVLTNGTTTISGNVQDGGNGRPLGGALLTVQGGNFFAVALAGTNGVFTAGVTPGSWQVEVENEQMARRAYLVPQNGLQVDATTGSVAGVSIALPKATALFYGTFTNMSGASFPGVGMSANDAANQFDTSGAVDAGGNYCVAVLGGTNVWSCGPDNSDPVLAPYIISGFNNTNLNVGQALLQNFTALLATQHITGYVRANGSSPITNINVSAGATINGIPFFSNSQTDTNGNYSLPVANGSWNVGLDCNYLNSLGYNCPGFQDTNIFNADAVVNFIVSTLAITTTLLPNGTNGVFYSQTFGASGGQPPYTWSPSPGFSLPGGLSLATNGVLSGTPTATGSFGFSVRVTDSLGATADQMESIYFVPAALEIMTTNLPEGTNGEFYFQQMQVNGGQPPYTWYLPQGPSTLPPGLNFNTNGVLSGVPATNGLFNFQVAVFVNNPFQSATQTLSLTIAPPPLQITTASPLPNATQGNFYSFALSAFGGAPPYTWALAPGSASLPAGLSLSTNGVLSGTPSVNGGFSFIAQVTDTVMATNSALLSLSITNGAVGPTPVVLSGQAYYNGEFQFNFYTLAGTNYTIQYASTLPGPWTSVLTFAGPGGPMTIIDPNATAGQRYYRIRVGP